MLGFHQPSLSLRLVQHICSVIEEILIEEIIEEFLKEYNETFWEFLCAKHPKLEKTKDRFHRYTIGMLLFKIFKVMLNCKDLENQDMWFVFGSAVKNGEWRARLTLAFLTKALD